MHNLEIWEQVERPPEDALKSINSGRLKGMTDISPLWRMKIMTEIFGPCGIGWGWSPDKLWTEPGHNNEVMCFAEVTLWYIHGEKTGYVPGVGGSKIVEHFAGKNYSISNDEGFKMATTDALSTAMKAIGVGADIYAGKWDGSKYIDLQLPKQPPKGDFKKAMEAIQKIKSEEEFNKVSALLKERSWTEEEEASLNLELKENQYATNS